MKVKHPLEKGFEPNCPHFQVSSWATEPENCSAVSLIAAIEAVGNSCQGAVVCSVRLTGEKREL